MVVKLWLIGTPEDMKKSKTITGEWLSGKKKFILSRNSRKPKKWLKIYGAKEKI